MKLMPTSYYEKSILQESVPLLEDAAHAGGHIEWRLSVRRKMPGPWNARVTLP